MEGLGLRQQHQQSIHASYQRSIGVRVHQLKPQVFVGVRSWGGKFGGVRSLVKELCGGEELGRRIGVRWEI